MPRTARTSPDTQPTGRQHYGNLWVDHDERDRIKAAALSASVQQAKDFLLENKLPFSDFTHAKRQIFRDLKYTPHTGQAALHAAQQRFKFIAAGARWGKSLAAAYEVLPRLYMDKQRGWIVGKTYMLAEYEFRYIVEAIQKLGHQDLFTIRDRSPYGQSVITAKGWDSELRVVTAHRPGNLMGAELDYIVLSEAGEHTSADIWNRILQPRLLSRKGCAIIPTTPRGKNHWLFKVWQQAKLNPEYWYTAQGHAADNPNNTHEEMERLRREMPHEWYSQQVCGDWISAESLLIPEFNETKHVFPNLEHDARFHWVEKLGGIDFGYRNPTHAILASDGTIGVMREVTRTGDTAQLMVDAMDSIGLREATTIYCDPSSTNQIAELKLAGFTTRAARKHKVLAGIRTLRHRLLATVDGGRPTLLIDSSCKVLIEQMQNYVASGKTLDDGEPIPLKEDDHGVDALRYLMMSDDTRTKVFDIRNGQLIPFPALPPPQSG